MIGNMKTIELMTEFGARTEDKGAWLWQWHNRDGDDLTKNDVSLILSGLLESYSSDGAYRNRLQGKQINAMIAYEVNEHPRDMPNESLETLSKLLEEHWLKVQDYLYHNDPATVGAKFLLKGEEYMDDDESDQPAWEYADDTEPVYDADDEKIGKLLDAEFESTKKEEPDPNLAVGYASLEQHRCRLSITLSKEYFPGLKENEKHVRAPLFFSILKPWHEIDPSKLIDFSKMTDAQKLEYDKYCQQYGAYLDVDTEKALTKRELQNKLDEYFDFCKDESEARAAKKK